MKRSKLNLLQFPRETWRFMALRIVFSAVTVILSLFLNTFLLRSYGSFSQELISYQIIMRVSQPVGVFVALLVSSWLSPMITQVLGLLLYLLSMVLLCLFGQGISGMYPMFAVLLGFADAFYFSVNCMQILCFTVDENRDRFNGVLGVITGVISVVLPIVSGSFLARFTDFTGYRIIFGIAALGAVVCLVLAARLRIQRPKRKPRVLASLKRIYSNKSCLRCILANGLTHCRANTLSVYMTLLIYNLIANEAVLGLQSTLSSIASLIAVAVYGVVVRSANRTKSSLLATGLVLIPCIGLLLGLNVVTLLLFSLLYAFTGTFINTPVAFTYYKSIEALGLGADAGPEVQLAADIVVALTSVPGFLIIAFVPRTNGWAVAVLATMILTSVVSTVLIRKADRDLGIHKV